MHPDSAKCCVAPEPQLRDTTNDLAVMLEKANDIAEAIEDKLYGINQSEACDKACPPATVQSGVNRSVSAVQRLLNRLDGINSRL